MCESSRDKLCSIFTIGKGGRANEFSNGYEVKKGGKNVMKKLAENSWIPQMLLISTKLQLIRRLIGLLLMVQFDNLIVSLSMKALQSGEKRKRT